MSAARLAWGVVLAGVAALIGRSAPAADAIDWRSVPLTSIDGAALDTGIFRGKVVLVVNTASLCGFTAQYAGLEDLWRRYRARGLIVLGVPSNDFGAQEPADNEAIRSFCEVKFGIDFPLLEKTAVTGPGAHPIYRWAREETGFWGAPRWNFYKILIGRDGKLIDWFTPLTVPGGGSLERAIEHAL